MRGLLIPRRDGVSDQFLLATYLGLVIFTIFALDRSFHGDLGLGPEPYQLLFDQLDEALTGQARRDSKHQSVWSG